MIRLVRGGLSSSSLIANRGTLETCCLNLAQLLYKASECISRELSDGGQVSSIYQGLQVVGRYVVPLDQNATNAQFAISIPKVACEMYLPHLIRLDLA